MPSSPIKMKFEFDKPLEQVFAQLSDHEFFGKTCGINMKRVVDGQDGANGLGSVRKINIGILPSFDETITTFEPNKLIEYKITRGSPIKNHKGTMVFSARDKGCVLDYEIALESKIPGTSGLIKTVLKHGISSGLVRYAKQ